jgi:hypothetical protein
MANFNLSYRGAQYFSYLSISSSPSSSKKRRSFDGDTLRTSVSTPPLSPLLSPQQRASSPVQFRLCSLCAQLIKPMDRVHSCPGCETLYHARCILFLFGNHMEVSPFVFDYSKVLQNLSLILVELMPSGAVTTAKMSRY